MYYCSISMGNNWDRIFAKRPAEQLEFGFMEQIEFDFDKPLTIELPAIYAHPNNVSCEVGDHIFLTHPRYQKNGVMYEKLYRYRIITREGSTVTVRRDP